MVWPCRDDGLGTAKGHCRELPETEKAQETSGRTSSEQPGMPRLASDIGSEMELQRSFAQPTSITPNVFDGMLSTRTQLLPPRTRAGPPDKVAEPPTPPQPLPKGTRLLWAETQTVPASTIPSTSLVGSIDCPYAAGFASRPRFFRPNSTHNLCVHPAHCLRNVFHCGFGGVLLGFSTIACSR